MTGHPNDPEHVPGQLDLTGKQPTADLTGSLRISAADRGDLERELHRVRIERERVEQLIAERTAEALHRLTIAATTYTVAGAELDAAVTEARSYGATWQDVGRAAGMTRQAAWQRWGSRG